jgi:predicted phosphodiesterase
MNRRRFIGSLATAGAAPAVVLAAENETPSEGGSPRVEILSPPVIQNPTETSFSVSWMINGTATGWVEWGTTKALGNVTRPSHHGLVGMSHYALSVKVSGFPVGASIYYRVVTMPVTYHNAYSIEKGEPIQGEIRQANLPSASAESCSLVMVNDTHDHAKTVAALAQRIGEIDPDALLWNGDAANTFDDTMQVARICLSPGQGTDDPASGGWASTRPLFFTFGNHDARGQSARILPEVLTPWPLSAGDPDGLAPTPYGAGRYCFTKRMGPLAIVCLDTGEDKPDARDVWGGMAAYEPYREAQKEWLVKALKRPEIAEAPYLLTFCHIPLRGLDGQNDGMGETGYAGYSGFGQKLWMKTLIEAGCQMILSGHTHRHRIDEPNDEFPLYQVVSGGPRSEQARLIQIRADKNELRLIVENLKKEEVSRVVLKPRV